MNSLARPPLARLQTPAAGGRAIRFKFFCCAASLPSPQPLKQKKLFAPIPRAAPPRAIAKGKHTQNALLPTAFLPFRTAILSLRTAFAGILQSFAGILQPFAQTLQPIAGALQSFARSLQAFARALQPFASILQPWEGALQPWERILQPWEGTMQAAKRPFSSIFDGFRWFSMIFDDFQAICKQRPFIRPKSIFLCIQFSIKRKKQADRCTKISAVCSKNQSLRKKAKSVCKHLAFVRNKFIRVRTSFSPG